MVNSLLMNTGSCLRGYMAIRIANIIADGRRPTNEHQLAVARQVEEFLAEAGIEGTVQISRYYSDRWYKLDKYAQLLKDGL